MDTVLVVFALFPDDGMGKVRREAEGGSEEGEVDGRRRPPLLYELIEGSDPAGDHEREGESESEDALGGEGGSDLYPRERRMGSFGGTDGGEQGVEGISGSARSGGGCAGGGKEEWGIEEGGSGNADGDGAGVELRLALGRHRRGGEREAEEGERSGEEAGLTPPWADDGMGELKGDHAEGGDGCLGVEFAGGKLYGASRPGEWSA